MAQRVVTKFVSDLSGQDLGDAGQTVKFGWLGGDYEIDLSQAEADQFAQAMDKYLSAGRRVGGRRQSGSGNATSSRAGRTDLNEIREWARANGEKVSTRGRIAKSVIEAYEAAH